MLKPVSQLIFITLLSTLLFACGGGGGGGGGGSSIAAPTSLSAVATSSTNIDLSWTDNANDETGYTVERSTTSGSGFSVLTTLVANATSYTDTTGTELTTYYYRVRATKDLESSAFSNQASAQTQSAVVGNVIPFSAGKKWLYSLNYRNQDSVGPNDKIFVGESVLVAEREGAYQGRTAWRVVRYDFETVPTTKQYAFDVTVDYIYQDVNGLERWYAGNPGTWRRILSTQMNSFSNNTLLFKERPTTKNGATTTQSVQNLNVGGTTYSTVAANANYREGSGSSSFFQLENHEEYYTPGTGLVAASWDFFYNDKLAPGGTLLVTRKGSAELKAIDTGAFPEMNSENEANDTSATAQSIASANSIVAAKTHISDAGSINSSVTENSQGVNKIEDWYTFQRATSGSFRLDLKYDYYSNGQFNDIDVYLFRGVTLGGGETLTLVASSRLGDSEAELINMASLPAGKYYIAVQAFDTPSTAAVDYWFMVR